MSEVFFDGVCLNNYCDYIFLQNTENTPERVYEKVQIPGRNGALLIDQKYYRNVTREYAVIINTGNVSERFNEFKNLISQKIGYKLLEDDDDAEVFMEAKANPISDYGVAKQGERVIKFTLSFDRKPQKFLKSGTIPIQYLPPYFVGNNFQTHLIPVVEGKDMTFTVHCKNTDTLTITVKTYDNSGTQLTSTAYTCVDGDTETVTFANTDIYWMLNVGGYTDADKTSVQIATVTQYNGEQLEINAACGRTLYLINPTGYYAKPLLECYINSLATFDINNYENSIKTDWYQMSVNSIGISPNLITHFWIDCELQYLYDEDKNNCTKYLTITDAKSDIGESLVFPQFGEDVRLIMYASSYAKSDGIGLVNVYPRWWRL